MADWYGTARTNYFHVNNRDEFARWASSIEGITLIEDKEGRVGMLFNTEFGGWPREIYDEEADDYVEVDVVATVAAHLRDGAVAVFVEVGAEKLRYVTGNAVATNSKGESVEVSLGDIYAAARSLGDDITLAEY